MSKPVEWPNYDEGAGPPVPPPAVQPPRCLRCGTILRTPGYTCHSCGAIQQVAAPVMPYPVMIQYVAPPKSAALAVFLTFLWLGMGHLYAGRIATGIVLALIDLVLVMMAFSLIGLLFAFPVWCLLFIIAAPLSAIAASEAGTAAPMPYAAPPVR